MRRLWLVLAFFLLASAAYGKERAFGYCEDGNQTVSTAGITSNTLVQRSYPPCRVTVYDAGTTNKSAICSDNLQPNCTVLGNPFTSTTTGYWFFYAVNGRYDVHFDSVGVAGCPGGFQCIATPFTHGDYLLCDPADNQNACGSGGGGVGAHQLLDQPVHTDTITHTPPNTGDTIAGSCGTPNFWEAVPIGTLAQVYTVTSVNGHLCPRWVNAPAATNMTRRVFEWVALCDNGGPTAQTGWDLPATNGMVAACKVDGVNATVQGVLHAADGNIAYFTWPLPPDFISFSQANIQFTVNDTTQNHTVLFALSTACTASNTNVADTPAFNAAQNFTTATIPAGATANALFEESIAAVTSTGCPSGDGVHSPGVAHFKLQRGTDTSSDTAVAVTGAIEVDYNGSVL